MCGQKFLFCLHKKSTLTKPIIKTSSMNKFLLLAALAVSASSLPMNAETKYYAGNPEQVFGLLGGISSNGQYAVVADEENNYSYMWNLDNPTEFKEISDMSLLYGVADNGLAVGAIFTDTQYRAAIYNDGEWTRLPSHSDLLNEQYAICVTPDAKVISGYEFDFSADADMGGRYYPVVWILNEDSGEYELIKFNDLKLPDHQGFITECMSADGKYIGGRLYCGFASEIPAIIDVENHEIKYWNKLEVRLEPWEYKGKYYGGMDENGKQIWLEDKDDPRVWLYEEQYIDGLHNTSDETSFSGEFMGADAQGNLYGHRSILLQVSADGESGTLTHGACVYNINTGEFTDFDEITTFTLGYDNATKLFANNAKMVTIDDNGIATSQSIKEGLGFSTSDDISAVTKGSADGKVLGGIYGIFNAAKQAPDYFPFIIVLDEAMSGISEIAIDNSSNIMILTGAGRIEVANANSVAIYDLDGKLVSSSASSLVKPGIYVVKADRISKKVAVK